MNSNAPYKFVRQILSGSYGAVIEVEKDGVRFALKEFKMNSDKSRLAGSVYLTEVDFLRRCDHVNILKLIEVSYGIPYSYVSGDEISPFTCDNIYLIMPLAEMSLCEYIRMDSVTVPMLKRFMVQLVSAANYLHVRGIGHRDFKSPNVLIFKDPTYSEAMNIKLCDFGMGKHFTLDVLNSGHVGTDRYKAPELLLGRRSYGKPIDVWALGVLFFEMFNQCWPFEKQSTDSSEIAASLEILTKIFMNRGAPTQAVYSKLIGGKHSLISFETIKKWSPKSVSQLYSDKSNLLKDFEKDSAELPNFGTLEQFTHLLDGMLALDPDVRLTMEQVIDHPFFSTVPKKERGTFIWRDLYITHEEKPPLHILEKTGNDARRQIGIDVLSRTKVDCSSLMYRSLFQGLDIFDRCLLFIDTRPEHDTIDIGLLAFCSLYIAAKLFLNDSVPDARLMMPGVSFGRTDIIVMEKFILETVLDWQIYRPTVYDLIKNKSLQPATLWVVMTTKPAIYGSNIEKIAQIYMTKVRH